jgi:hypothetical protein
MCPDLLGKLSFHSNLHAPTTPRENVTHPAPNRRAPKMDVHRGPTRSRTAPIGSAETYHQPLFSSILLTLTLWLLGRGDGTYIGNTTSDREQEVQSRILGFTCFTPIA